MMFSFYFVAFYRWRKCRRTSQAECRCQEAAFQGKAWRRAWGKTVPLLPARGPCGPPRPGPCASVWAPGWRDHPPTPRRCTLLRRMRASQGVPPGGPVGGQSRDTVSPVPFPQTYKDSALFLILGNGKIIWWEKRSKATLQKCGRGAKAAAAPGQIPHPARYHRGSGHCSHVSPPWWPLGLGWNVFLKEKKKKEKDLKTFWVKMKRSGEGLVRCHRDVGTLGFSLLWSLWTLWRGELPVVSPRKTSRGILIFLLCAFLNFFLQWKI